MSLKEYLVFFEVRGGEPVISLSFPACAIEKGALHSDLAKTEGDEDAEDDERQARMPERSLLIASKAEEQKYMNVQGIKLGD